MLSVLRERTRLDKQINGELDRASEIAKLVKKLSCNGKRSRDSLMKDDKAEVLTIEGREVRVTHPDKPYFSKQTKLSKLDLVRYYL